MHWGDLLESALYAIATAVVYILSILLSLTSEGLWSEDPNRNFLATVAIVAATVLAILQESRVIKSHENKREYRKEAARDNLQTILRLLIPQYKDTRACLYTRSSRLSFRDKFHPYIFTSPTFENISYNYDEGTIGHTVARNNILFADLEGYNLDEKKENLNLAQEHLPLFWGIQSSLSIPIFNNTRIIAIIEVYSEINLPNSGLQNELLMKELIWWSRNVTKLRNNPNTSSYINPP